MSAPINPAATYDFNALAELRSKARGNEEAVARKVGEQFEAMFIDMMMSSVREANKPLKSDLFASSSTDTYEEMYHKELSLHLATQGSLGIADWVVEQVQTRKTQSKALADYQAQSPTQTVGLKQGLGERYE
ncbi:MAG: rod-binding protein [Aequoribacter sp.]|jgi:flagellar protein FlgJ|uniref:rod-binding protein n=1 Tax=Aequoribacter sp. TaxID=2847771 RepID=UPI003C3B1E41